MFQLPSRRFQWPILKGISFPTKSRSYGTNNGSINSGTPKSSIQPHRGPEKRHVTMGPTKVRVSTTRGVPSTSNDLKEAFCEKIPLHYDLLRKFRSQHGSSVISEITVNDMYNGLKGVSTSVRETSEMDSQHGIRYRGLTIPEVLGLLPLRGAAPSPEAVFWLLLTGDVPTLDQTASLVADWNSRRRKRKSCWLETDDGSFVGRIIRGLPENITPLGKLSIALTALDTSQTSTKKSGSGIMSYADWEHIYEEGMEFLALLPAIVGLVRKSGKNLKEIVKEDSDWVEFFINASDGLSDTVDGAKNHSLADFLRLYIAINADDDGGSPAAHVTEIMGAMQIPLNKAFASSVHGYYNEPATGSIIQCTDFQSKVRSALGAEPKEEALKDFIGDCFDRANEITGHREGAGYDPRYAALSEFARKHMPKSPEIKLSKEISRILTSMAQSTGQRLIWPEQSTLAAPIFRFYGLDNMEFNQVLLCMSRALGAVASIIWNRAVGIPVEHPKSRCTHNYVNYIRDGRTSSRIKRVGFKHLKSSRKSH